MVFTAPKGPGLKGAVIAEFLRWYAQQYGRERLTRGLSRLSPGEQRLLRFDDQGLPVVMPFAWYPVTIIGAVLDEMVGGLSPEARLALARAAGREAGGATFRGVYKTMFRAVMSPARLRRHDAAFWGFFHDTGVSELKAEAPNVHRSVVRHWAGHHPFLCEAASESRAIIYEAMGCSGVTRERLSCVGDGARECAARFRWDARGPLDHDERR